MPELPEVETVCRALHPFVKGKTITAVQFRSRKIRNVLKPSWRKLLTGQKIHHVTRRAKYILVHTDDFIILIHLGMTGVIRCVTRLEKEALQKHDHVTIFCHDGSGFVFNDARRFGQFEVIPHRLMKAHKALSLLGPEPFDPSLTAKTFHEKMKGTRAIKLVIMDQAVLVGVGNIYASEALYLARIHPTRPAQSLTADESSRLLGSIRRVLKHAIEKGGSTLRDFKSVDGDLGYFQHHFHVYDREGDLCKKCVCDVKHSGGIQKITQGGRSTFFCATLQK